jgi:hypothetical protein
MACPYFYPIAKAEGLRSPARAPLGVVHEGRCDAGGQAVVEACNFGYARGHCEAFPAESLADAVRFTWLGNRAIYILERDYSPVAHGDAADLTGVLARQAEVFREWVPK